ncbi:Inositol monophosphatase family [Fragilaria crotonensis]|nr:Inositol monophosphatase family [Fragilaria crotonensis]
MVLKTSVPTLQLLSALIDAAQYGSSTIARNCNAASSKVVYKEVGEARSAMTVADTAAQKIIVSSLLKSFPSLCIIGEEDDSIVRDEESESCSVALNLDLKLDFQTCFQNSRLPVLPDELDLDDIVVYVDPLDGTREFVEGRLDNVQCLVGACYKSIPVMGAIGLPFNNAAGEVEIIYGLVGRGVGKFILKADSIMDKIDLPEFKSFSDGDPIFLSSGDSNASLLLDSIRVVEAVFPSVQRQTMGACGNKMVKVMTGESTLAVMHDKTSLWDTCAPTAILNAVGGKVTDLLGDPLVYSSQELGNKLGVVASVAGASHLHDLVTTAMRSDSKVASHFKK